jgi:hypothetical protein
LSGVFVTFRAPFNEEKLDSLSSLSHPHSAAATDDAVIEKGYSLAASDYFDEALEVDLSSNRTTRVYYTPRGYYLHFISSV